SFISMASIYHILPRLLNVSFNQRLARWHFWLLCLGLIIFLGILHTAGIVQGTMWLAKLEEYDFVTGSAVFKPAVEFIDIVRLLHPFYFTLWIGAGLMVSGMMLFVLNVFLTFNKATKT
ncbi:MAG: cbb3-type cytochrome c oxidase subunit I, partial [Candidatus Brocadiales bacterium]